jgi:hypothetical protein
LSFITDPMKLKLCTVSKLCCPICKIHIPIYNASFALISKYFVFC